MVIARGAGFEPGTAALAAWYPTNYSNFFNLYLYFFFN